MYIIYQTLFQDVTKRPYPSAGARYPLEIYVVNNNIKDIQKGIHYYNALSHEIIFNYSNNKKSVSGNYQKRLNEYVRSAQGYPSSTKPDIIFVITAVFARTMWKYKNIGLSLILTDLGCLYQTMYLVATALNLANLIRDWLKLLLPHHKLFRMVKYDR